MTRVTISDSAKQLCITEESVKLLIKFHRICADKVGDELIVKDDDIYYFHKYLEENGKLPDLPM